MPTTLADLHPRDFAIGVGRVSDAVQTSLPMQHRKIGQCAERLGIPIPADGLYEDIESRTAGLGARLSLQDALVRCLDPHCKVVIFFDDSRLLGDERQALELCETFSEAGVRVFYENGTEEDIASRQGQLIAMIKGWQNKNEVLKTRMRVKTTLRDMVENDGRIVSRPGYGVRVVPLSEAPCGGSCRGDNKNCDARHSELSKKNTVYVVDEEELKAMQIMYEHMANFGTWGDLERKLAALGILTRARTITRSKTNVGKVVGGMAWRKSDLRRLMVKEFNSGFIVWNATEVVRKGNTTKQVPLPIERQLRVKHSLGPLVDPELWQRAQVGIERRSKTREEQRAYPLLLWDDFIQCGRCGWGMSPRRRSTRTKIFGALGGSEYDYSCHGTYNPYCSCTVNHVIPDRAIDYALGAEFTASRLMPTMVVTFEADSERKNAEGELAALGLQLGQLASERTRTKDMERRGRYSADEADVIHERIDAEETAALRRQSELSAAPSGAILSDKVPDLIQRLMPLLRDESIDIAERRSSLGRVVEKIVVDRPRIRVVLRKAAIAEIFET